MLAADSHYLDDSYYVYCMQDRYFTEWIHFTNRWGGPSLGPSLPEVKAQAASIGRRVLCRVRVTPKRARYEGQVP